MMEITRITNIDNNKHIALLDTSSISFMQELEGKGIKNFHRLIDHEKNAEASRPQRCFFRWLFLQPHSF